MKWLLVIGDKEKQALLRRCEAAEHDLELLRADSEKVEVRD